MTGIGVALVLIAGSVGWTVASRSNSGDTDGTASRHTSASTTTTNREPGSTSTTAPRSTTSDAPTTTVPSVVTTTAAPLAPTSKTAGDHPNSTTRKIVLSESDAQAAGLGAPSWSGEDASEDGYQLIAWFARCGLSGSPEASERGRVLSNSYAGGQPLQTMSTYVWLYPDESGATGLIAAAETNTDCLKTLVDQSIHDGIAADPDAAQIANVTTGLLASPTLGPKYGIQVDFLNQQTYTGVSGREAVITSEWHLMRVGRAVVATDVTYQGTVNSVGAEMVDKPLELLKQRAESAGV